MHLLVFHFNVQDELQGVVECEAQVLRLSSFTALFMAGATAVTNYPLVLYQKLPKNLLQTSSNAKVMIPC